MGSHSQYIMLQKYYPTVLIHKETRMHSSRMRTGRSSSHLLGVGGLPQWMLKYPLPQVLAWRPPKSDPSTSPLGVGLETPPGQTPQLPPRCGPGDPPMPDPSTSPLGVGLETPQLPPWVWAGDL